MTSAAAAGHLDVISPVDGSVYATRPLATAAEVDAALARAVDAQAAWRQVPVADRAATCRRMVDQMVDGAREAGIELAWQMGRPAAQAAGEITGGMQERATHMAGIAEEALASIEIEASTTARRIIRREPVGVVLVVAPWNYPYLTSVNTVVPALLAGNAVILKMAAQTPLAAERYAAAFDAAGLPPGLFQFLHLDHDAVARLIGDRRVGHVAFTGSVGGGRAVQRAVGERFTTTGLELGGKDPAYIRPDADLDRAVAAVVDGAFFNSGQSCCGIERVYVHRAVHGEVVERFVEQVRGYRLGDPLDPSTTLGPMVRAGAAEAVRAQVAAASAKGARVLVHENEFPVSRPGTPYLGPQVLVDVDHSMAIMTEETFGPAIGIMPVAGDSEAVTLMNDSSYGLTASIWTADVDAALSIGDRVETGTCFMNRCDYLDPALPWTGIKDSGRGATLSQLGFEALTRPKSFHFQL